MAEVTLGDYAGYIFTEMVRAREAADAYSRALADRYNQDEVLRHFPVPRFRTPKVDITVPVLISGARFSRTVRFVEPEQDFVDALAQRAEAVRAEVEHSQGGLPRRRLRVGGGEELSEVRRLAADLHAELVANPDPSHPEAVVATWWRQIFRAALAGARLLTYYLETDESNRLLARTTAEVLDHVRRRTVVSHTEIESLLVDPETVVVADGSTDSTVFVVRAEMLEEGFLLREVQEEDGTVSRIVEFD